MKNKLFLTVLVLFLLLIALYSFEKIEAFENILDIEFEPMSLGIPKIIHQTAPADTKKWPQVWHKCQQTWKKHFPTYQYIMWTDEDLNNLIQTQFPEFWGIFKGYDKNIKRFDVARYFILYKYGGIYLDMDIMCRT